VLIKDFFKNLWFKFLNKGYYFLNLWYDIIAVLQKNPFIFLTEILDSLVFSITYIINIYIPEIYEKIADIYYLFVTCLNVWLEY
jgi:hypothetical protein